ncbi:MAG: hypothetical protein JSR85_04140 [Proteobacteria bacterium]|nr:hypothetical protein [Pseudomonadota bacterium]
MLKFIIPFFMTMSVAWGQENTAQEKLNLLMCDASEYRFDEVTLECIYCAHGLQYDDKQKCVGTPNVLGKCNANHHYHAATQECMFCAQGYAFNEISRSCEKKK